MKIELLPHFAIKLNAVLSSFSDYLIHPSHSTSLLQVSPIHFSLCSFLLCSYFAFTRIYFPWVTFLIKSMNLYLPAFLFHWWLLLLGLLCSLHVSPQPLNATVTQASVEHPLPTFFPWKVSGQSHITWTLKAAPHRTWSFPDSHLKLQTPTGYLISPFRSHI